MKRETAAYIECGIVNVVPGSRYCSVWLWSDGTRSRAAYRGRETNERLYVECFITPSQNFEEEQSVKWEIYLR